MLEETKADAKLVRELEEYGVVKGEMRGGVRYFDETEREIIARGRRAGPLRRRGAQPARVPLLRRPRGEPAAADPRPGPALAQPQRRKEAVEALENLAAVATHLKHLLLIRDLRKIVR